MVPTNGPSARTDGDRIPSHFVRQAARRDDNGISFRGIRRSPRAGVDRPESPRSETEPRQRIHDQGQTTAVLSVRTRPLLARITWSARWPRLQTVNVPICNAPFSMRAWPMLVYDT